MVLRKERPPSGVANPRKMSNEQPVTKRQRIDNNKNGDETSLSSSSTTTSATSSPSSTIQDINDNNTTLDLIVPSTSTTGTSTILASTSSSSTSTTTNNDNKNDLHLIINPSDSSSSKDEVDKITTDDHQTENLFVCKNQQQQLTTDIGEFEMYLIKQCLCNVTERTLRKSFQSHYNHDLNGLKRIANLCEWPTNKLIQFLSNLKLLFDIYLKQNLKGLICSRIMDVCDALIRNDHNLIDELIELNNYNNKYIQYLACTVLAMFLVIAKNNLNDNWLKKLVDNLFLFEQNFDTFAIRKIQFSLDIIKSIVEWKDIDIHPLDDDNDDDIIGNDIVNNQQQHQHQQPPQLAIENNYFAMNFDTINDISSGAAGSAGAGSSSSSSSSTTTSSNNRIRKINNKTITNDINCQLITLTDSESFDTTQLKCLTIKILENKWPALVKNMSNMIVANNQLTNQIENCIITFLDLWENIISVKANLSIIETLPFYAQLDKFELLLNQELSSTIYKQMLCLFNEALCYGSTLALQDLLPEETCLLAHQIVRHIKDYRILDSLPRKQQKSTINLTLTTSLEIQYDENFLKTTNLITTNLGNNDNNHEQQKIDKIILQKMILLVLKSVAITVKEIRTDSSDSSLDSQDYDAYQDMILIERSIRDVIKKLEQFLKQQLLFHPDTHFSKLLIHLFDDQDDHLIESMVCTLDIISGITYRNNNQFPELLQLLNPILIFLEFLNMITNSSELLLDLLVSNETCFLLYLLRFLKYIRLNWSMFQQCCQQYNNEYNNSTTTTTIDTVMTVLIRLRLQISRLVSKSLYPYDISPVLRLLESCESLYEGNELS